MFTAELKAHGIFVGHILVNYLGPGIDNKDQISYEYYEPEASEVIRGILLIEPEKDFRSLLSIVLDDINATIEDGK